MNNTPFFMSQSHLTWRGLWTEAAQSVLLWPETAGALTERSVSGPLPHSVAASHWRNTGGDRGPTTKTHACTHNTSIHMRNTPNTHTQTHTHTHTHACTHTHAHTHTHARTHARTHTHTHTHTHTEWKGSRRVKAVQNHMSMQFLTRLSANQHIHRHNTT